MSNFVWKLLSKKKFPAGCDPQQIADLLLSNRGIKGKIENFFNLKLSDVLNFKIDGLAKGVARVKKAIKKNEKIVVFADYDADGICGTAILWELLYSLRLDCLPYVPHRVTEGYGLNIEAIEKLKNEGVKLIITVDHGISAAGEIEFAKREGIDVVVTDHHSKPKKLPAPAALVHTTKLSGAGVAFCFAYALAKDFGRESEIMEKLDLAAIATIADLVPLTSYNRTIVKLGLEKLNQTRRPGLLALFAQTGLFPGQIGERDVSHVLVPLINVSGRLESAIFSLRLLCTQSPIQARELAQQLASLNSQRQEMVAAAVGKARNTVVANSSIGVLVDDWHEGIIGLVASKMVDEFARPMIVIAKGKKFSKGSARSVASWNIVETLRSVSDLLVDIGGHPAAAGFTIETQKISLFQKRIENLAPNLGSSPNERSVLEIDCQIDIKNITLKLFQLLEKFRPFGVDNPPPLFLTANVLVQDSRIVGQDGSHLKLKVAGFDAIAFGQAKSFGETSPGDKVDLVYTVELDTFANHQKLQLKVKDLKTSKD